jgi:predicted amidophosphoribosyltransferase
MTHKLTGLWRLSTTGSYLTCSDCGKHIEVGQRVLRDDVRRLNYHPACWFTPEPQPQEPPESTPNT